MATDLGTLLVRVGIRGVQDVTTGLQQVGDSAKAAGNSIGVLDIALGTLAGNLASKVVGGILSLPAMFYNAGAAAVATSNKFESIRVGLEAITGSAAEAERKMQFIKALAIPSEYTAGQLAEAGMMIEGMGLRLEKVLPLITKLTMGTRRTGEEYQRMAVSSVFGRLAQGVQPEMEAMSAFGISRGALAEFGAKFGPNGEMLSSAQEMLDALERLINTRFGRALELAANSGQAKMSALADMWEQSVARIGDAVKRMVMPVVDRLGSWLQFMLTSGWLDALSNKLGAAFGMIGKDAPDRIDNVMATVLAVAEKLPDLMKNAAAVFAEGIKVAVDQLVKAVSYLSAGTLGLRIDRSMQEALPDYMFGPNAPTWVKAVMRSIPGIGMFLGARSKAEVLAGFDEEIKRREALAAKSTYAFLDATQGQILSAGSGSMSGPTIDQLRMSYLQAFKSMGAAGTALPYDPNPEQGWGRLAAPITDTANASRATARNTREMADAFRDMRGTLFGGGQRARGAVSSIEAQIALARALGTGIG